MNIKFYSPYQGTLHNLEDIIRFVVDPAQKNVVAIMPQGIDDFIVYSNDEPSNVVAVKNHLEELQDINNVI